MVLAARFVSSTGGRRCCLGLLAILWLVSAATAGAATSGQLRYHPAAPPGDRYKGGANADDQVPCWPPQPGVCLLRSRALPIRRSVDARTASRPTYCGEVLAHRFRFRVDVVSGRAPCPVARRVITYVLTHGAPTQGSPGKDPAGWVCGYAHGYYHGGHARLGRSGPSCVSRGRTVKGTEAGYTPA